MSAVKKNYIGLACSGHDQALAIVDSDGCVVFAEATERYLQSKRAIGARPDEFFCSASFIEAYCEPGTELVLCKTWSDEWPARVRAVLHARTRSVGVAETAKPPLRKFLDQRERDLEEMLRLNIDAVSASGRSIQRIFSDRISDVRAFDHHLTHAAAACFGSGFQDAICLVVDGIGEHGSVGCFHYQNGRLTPLLSRQADDLFAGLGLFYVDLCELVGFNHWGGEEWKVMGLAAFGEEDQALRTLLHRCLVRDGLEFRRPKGGPTALARIFTRTRQGERQGLFSSLAREGQFVFEQHLFGLCRHLRELGLSERLVLTGGCALNSSANGKVLQETGFRELFVPSAPADDGNAVGAAQLAYFEDHPERTPPTHRASPYLGSSLSTHAIKRVAQCSGFTCERLSRRDLPHVVAGRLSRGELVGWVQGRAEFGPRALGNRSILADPRRADMKGRVNEAVKFRESFRPFAPAILKERAHDFFEDYQESPYMERALRWRKGVVAQVPAVVHEDGTGRLQTVDALSNPPFYELLKAFDALTGVPILLNTSFNVMGKPIVHSVEDAVSVFATSNLDALVLEEHLFTKTSTPPSSITPTRPAANKRNPR